MSKTDNDFLKKLLATFKIETEEHVNEMSSCLIKLEKAPTAERQMEVIETVFREAHSLKGAARAVNMREIEAICQSLESVFAALKRKEIALSPELFDMLHQAVDTLSKLLLSTGAERTASEKSLVKELIQKLEGAPRGLPQPLKQETSQPLAVENPVPAETVRISTAKLDSILLQVEELLSVKLSASQRAAELREINATLALWKKERDSAFVKSLKSKLTSLSKSVENDYRSLDKMVENLLDDMKKALMLPFSSLLDVFPKFVHHLSHNQGKEAELVIQGEEIEIDRRILDEMKDPLIHLVRNCIDHGIEKSKERARKKKPPRGTVTIAVSRKNSSNVEVLISDDGGNIDIAKVKSTAVKLRIVSKKEADELSEQEALPLIFQSGVSTSPIVTDISGRGLGLAIVREKVEKLGGVVSLETHSNVETIFRILLPVTLAAFRGVLIRVDEHLLVLPTINVEQVVRVNKGEIKTVENRETIQLNGQAVSLVRLRDVLELARKSETNDSVSSVHVVVLGSAKKRIAFLVDEVINEQEVLVKSLGRHLSLVRNIAGATILGTGKAVPILNVPDLMKSAVQVRAAAGSHSGIDLNERAK